MIPLFTLVMRAWYNSGYLMAYGYATSVAHITRAIVTIVTIVTHVGRRILGLLVTSVDGRCGLQLRLRMSMQIHNVINDCRYYAIFPLWAKIGRNCLRQRQVPLTSIILGFITRMNYSDKS